MILTEPATEATKVIPAGKALFFAPAPPGSRLYVADRSGIPAL